MQALYPRPGADVACKVCCSSTITSNCDICNAAFESGFLPANLKQARVTIHPKKPSMNPSDQHSFRPISNLAFLSKLLERVVARQFIKHADQNDLLPTSNQPTVSFT